MPNRRVRPFGSIRLGSIAGVDVRLHWTWAIAASFIALTLGSSVFPAYVPGLSTHAYYTMGVLTALLFFVSLLLHELGHALQARRDGIPTREITLWMLGGIAQSEAPFATAGSEARVALAGPAVSAVLGGALVAAAQVASLPESLATVLGWLGWTNLLLLAFNLLPALPLDGGRVLRAALWRIYGNHARATRNSLRVSQLLAVTLVAFGICWSFAGGGVSGLWLAFIGVFLLSSGSAERALADMQVALSGLRVADVMTPHPFSVAPGSSAAELVSLARHAGHPVYPVVREGESVAGLVSVTSAEQIPARRRGWVNVGELVYAGDDATLDVEAEAASALAALAANPLHRSAVVRAGRLVGIVTLGDLIRAADRRARIPPDPAGTYLNASATNART